MFIIVKIYIEEIKNILIGIFLLMLCVSPVTATLNNQNNFISNDEQVKINDGLAEARLIEIYRLIANGNTRDALDNAKRLVNDFPNFQLAQLVFGDLLSIHSRSIRDVGDVPKHLEVSGSQNLQALQAESRFRINAIKNVPPTDRVPSQFVSLSRRNKHAIAVDTEKARLYLFENASAGPRLIANYYISVGKSGVGKTVEGDQRTPLGVYFVTSNLDPKKLPDLYGSGALPINYPNALDLRRGKTGSGIWLHGTPSNQFTRAPQATDGCVAVANPDLDRIIKTVEIKTTPVLIGKNLTWVRPSELISQKQNFSNTLLAWVNAKKSRNENDILKFYAHDFNVYGKDLSAFIQNLRIELKQTKSSVVNPDDVSLIKWSDDVETMIATFSDIGSGELNGRTVRQYWQRRSEGWKIIFEGLV